MTEKIEHRCCIKFCQKLGDNRVETIQKIQPAFGNDALSPTQIKQWFKRFKDGRASVESDHRSGGSSTSRNNEVRDQVREKVLEDCCTTVQEIAGEVGISIGSVHNILTEDLNLPRVSAKFAPKMLTGQQEGTPEGNRWGHAWLCKPWPRIYSHHHHRWRDWRFCTSVLPPHRGGAVPSPMGMGRNGRTDLPRGSTERSPPLSWSVFSLGRPLTGHNWAAPLILDLWSRPWGVARLLGLRGVPPRPHPSEGVGCTNITTTRLEVMAMTHKPSFNLRSGSIRNHRHQKKLGKFAAMWKWCGSAFLITVALCIMSTPQKARQSTKSTTWNFYVVFEMLFEESGQTWG